VKNRILVVNIFLVTLFVLASVSAFVGQNRAANDFRVRYKVTVESGGAGGRSSETITMIKGARERSESHMGYGYDTVTITQCDLKRTIQLSDTTKKYVITLMETGQPSVSTTPGTPAPAPATPSRSGGVVEYVTSSIDTGERKEMFGFTARHVKSSTSINASPDACNPGRMRTELDGWYIDLNIQFNCELNRPPTMPTSRTSSAGCRDQVKTRREGTAKTGYPLIETMKYFGSDGQLMFSQTKEVIELSRATLETALFDVPTGYTEATNTSELYAAPSITSMMSGMNQAQAAGSQANASTSAPGVGTTKRPGSLLVGVVQFNNKAGRPVSLDSLRQRLIANITGAGIDAIPLNASSQMEAEAEAKVKQCDFILYTDIAALKMNKIGGMFGSITGVQNVAKTEAKLEFRLFAVGESTPRLSSNASAKEEGEENSAGTALDAEARAVVSEVKKKRG
jgi:hypothetical protein